MTTSRTTPDELAPLTDGLFVTSDPVRIVGMKLAATMTVVALPDGGVLLHSPVAMTSARRDAVAALGTVTDLYAPNTFHHRWVGEWAAAFPEARVHAPHALRDKRRDLVIARSHDREPDARLGEVFEEIHVEGFWLEETLLVHRPSGTLIVADLVHNVGRPEDPWTRAYSTAMGFYDRVAISRMIRWTAFSDRRAARRSLDRLADCRFDRLVVGHGAPLEHGARDIVLDAYAWLRGTGPTLALPAPREPSRSACG